MKAMGHLGAIAGVGVLALGVAAGACGSGSSSGGGAGQGDGGGDSSTSSSGSGGGSSSGGSSSGGSGSSGGGSGSSSGGSSSSSGGDGGLASGRSFPDTNATIALLVDQLPTMNMAQMQFATSHYVGSEKQLLPVTQQLRALNPAFLMLHYHLAMWQSAADFIINGTSWGNDLPTVTTNETWFWHNTSSTGMSGRVTAPDGKFLMNVTVPAFQQYWLQSLQTQVKDGDYDAIFFDSASPALLQGWCGGTGANQDPRLAGTAAKDTVFPELGGTTWIDAWQTWIGALAGSLSAKGIPLIPNTGAFITGWDNTNYALTPGIFSEGFADPTFAVSDWQASTDELLKLAAADKIMILQNYLSAPTDVATRMYYLGNYLLVKGHHTYLDYFAAGPLEWYPEWSIDLGAPTMAPTTDVTTLASGGVYRRDFAKGSVLVNPTSSGVMVSLGGTYNQVVPSGGGAVDATGATPGTLTMQSVTSVTVGPTTAVVVLE
jgi:hypothetical protein